ncbi:MAG TPA: bifunctional glycosyltransferase/class I SAM-dependent methyltransferase [Bryobacteraceae bacterium]|nr:bifunctional glycosyltransferase/class I SAM-dependent methyltransferase [Bryobacteraceae bacterium]
MKLSILIPVYNERAAVQRSLTQVLAAPLPEEMERELIIVDDCSTDGTSAILDRFAASDPRIRLFRQEINQGKGAAVRFAIQQATGDFCIVQDADLEYDPSEYSRLLRPLLDGYADAVFGSRYLRGEQTRVLPFWHSMINKFLTLVSNMFCNLNVTDMETCYKVFRTDLLKSIPVRSNRFGFEPEITMKAGKRKLRIYEVPISYHGRTYEEGKKIGWKDGLKVFSVILWYWLIDDLYVEPYGRGSVNNLSGTPQYVSWMTRVLRPHVGNVVLEAGAGIGNVTGRLMGRTLQYVAGEKDPLFLHALRNRFLRTPNVEVRRLDPEDARDFEDLQGSMETVLCVNVLEYVSDPVATVHALSATLAPGGQLVILVPQGMDLFSGIDESLGHRRRFDEADLRQVLEKAGLEVLHTHQLNKIGKPAWWFHGNVLHARQINKLTLKLFDKSIWLWRRTEALMPWKGLSLIVVARRGGPVH